jgi:DHA1 family bicyclomycin/chloramphenicol resistance-like MFS transporter
MAKRNTVLIIFAFIITIIATDIYLPSFPSMAVFFKCTSDELQLSVPSYMIGGLLSPPIFGFASDHFGRKNTLLWGLSIFILGSFLCSYSFSLASLLIGRFIQGFGAVSVPIVGWAAIQDYYPGQKGAKIMAWIGSIISLGPLLAPSIGGFIDTLFGWRGNFFLLVIFSLTITLLMVFYFFDSRQIPQKKKLHIMGIIKSYALIFKNKKFIAYIMLSGCLMCGELCYLTVIPFFLQLNFHLTAEFIGIYISIISVAYIIGTFLASQLVHSVGIHKTILLGIFLSFLGAFVLLLLSIFPYNSVTFMVLATGLYMSGPALIWGPSTSAALQLFTNQRGSASAVRSLITHCSMGAGGVAGSLMSDFELKPLAIFLIVMCLFSLLFFYTLSVTKQDS